MTDEFQLPGRTTRRSAMPVLTIAALAAAFALGIWVLTSLRELELRESAHGDRLGAQLASLDQRELELAATQQRMAREVAALSGTRRAGLLATEAEHLARLAAQRLALMQDPAGAAALLAAADTALREIQGADTHAARAALARDRALLQDAAAIDIEAAWLRLAALPDRVDHIARPPATATSAGPAPAMTPVADAGTAGAWDRFRHALLSLVTIRRVDEPAAPIVTAGERELAAQNFRLLIEQAQLALLQRHAAIYRESLAQAARWLDRIAAGDPVLRARVQQELTALRALELGRQLPDLGDSLAATRALASRLLPETAPAAGASP